MSAEDARDLYDVAIVGMAGRFPGARDVAELWAHLREGVESIRTVTDDELAAAGVPRELSDDPAYVKRGAYLDDVAGFDAAFFGYSPREAEVLDPQQRLFLECCWHALEDAGCAPAAFGGAIGVYAGVFMSTYLYHNLMPHARLVRAMGELTVRQSNDKDFLAPRVSYKLNLRGPSVVIQTSCSTSLVAAHLACQGLLNRECDLALVGGASVQVPQGSGYLWQAGSVLSPDGCCRAFDARAEGTVFGQGVGAVVLKRLEDALDDGDRVYAVIKGSAINHDGALKVGFTAPSVEGQAEVIAEALAMAGVEARSIGYVEAHGTGTTLGDPIEIAALTQAYRAHTDDEGFCALGSVKTNMGHLGAAAGVVGLIKAALMLHHRWLPPTLHFSEPNPRIDFAASPFYVHTESRPWEDGAGPRRAGLSSFGMGGTNAHAILEEAPPAAPSDPPPPWQLLVLSAAAPETLDEMTARLATHLREHPELPPADVAFTSQVGRTALPHRRAVVCRDLADAAAVLGGEAAERLLGGGPVAGERPLAFLFPGQGAQYAGMTRELYAEEPAFRDEVDRCCELLRPALGRDLRQLLYPAPEAEEEAAERLADTAFTQPALFTVEYALSRLLASWGLRPRAMAGHSIGEYVAACLAGVLSLADALALVADRGRLMAALPAGAMLGVSLPAAELAPRLGGELALAAVNGPALCSVSGPPPTIEALAAELAGEGVRCRRLHTSHAFHSPMMEPILEPFRERVRAVELRPPAERYLSNLTGGWISEQEATDPDYWVRHLRQTVRFGDNLGHLLKEPDLVLLEVGPGRALSALAAQQESGRGRIVLSTVRHPKDEHSDLAFLLRAVARLWLAGVPVEWAGLHAGRRRRRVALPLYPFAHRRYWVEAPGAAAELPAPEESAAVAEEPPAAAAPLSSAHPRPPLATAYAAPGNDVERRLAEIWQELLGIDRVGVHDDFFELGGNSLLATQVISRMRDVVGTLGLVTLFDAPTIAAVAARVEKEEGELRPPPIEPVADRGAVPLSFPQQRLWFLDQLVPDNPVYNIPGALLLTGRLDVAAFSAAVRRVVDRHESLRTSFVERGGVPRQVVAPELALDLPLVDLEALGPAAAAEARRLAVATARRPFDLGRGPLLRMVLLRLAPDEHLAAFAMHHIISDGWSLGVFARDLAAFYSGAEPPPLAVQYPDFAVWQRCWLEGEGGTAARQLAWWRQRLAGAPAVLELPTDRPRPPTRAMRGAHAPVGYPAALVERLGALARERGATLFMTLLAGFYALLYRYTGQDDLAVGTPVAGRTRREVEGLVGFFVNTLVLRARLAGGPSFAELLERVRGVTLGAYEHQDLPFEMLVSELDPKRDLSRSPFFQVMLTFQNVFADPPRMPGLTLSSLTVDARAARFDLELQVWESAEGLEGVCAYDRDLFDATTMRRLTAHLGRLLAAAVADPARPLDELPLLSAGERQQLRREWNDTAGSCAAGAPTIPQRFRQWAAAVPDAVALACGDRVLTYGELDRRARRLAGHLRRLGAGPETRVGIAMERSLELMVALYGTLAAGAAYVPVDPSYPAERVRFMLEDARPRVVLTQARFADLAAAPDVCPVVCLDRDWPEVERADAAEPPAAPDPDSLAYVIYTSGSTGRPKGAMNSHRAIHNRLRWMQRAYRLGPDDRVLQKTPISFDVSVWELFWPLIDGARLVIARPGGHQDPTYLVRTVRREGVTTLHFVPSMLGVFLDEDGVGEHGGLARVICSGEALPYELEQRFFARLPGVELHNLYGPTEAAVDVTVWPCAADDGRSPVPIGRPIANTRVEVTDRRLSPVPIGVPGELLIGGVQVSRGYLARPALTASRFIPCPGGDPGARLYRTGDLVRCLAGGEVEFLGRIDHQVKVRGFRIELGEIEAALERHPAVDQAVVTAAADQRLVGYLVTRGAAPTVSELREHLGASLPAYMVPAAFVALAAFPLTPNGKVDRRALPAPEAERPELGARYAAPEGATEEMLAKTWEEVLGLDRVGVHDNFFDLGGDSLRLVQVHRRLREVDHDLTLIDLFNHPTVKALTAFLARERDRSLAADKVRERAATRRELQQRQRRARRKALT